MPAATYVQTSFLGGEVSKTYQGRLDHPGYRTWMNVCLNGLPMEQGAWVRRSGTQHCSTTRNGVAGRVITFDFKQAAPYTMEFTAGYLRFRGGPDLITTNDEQTVVSISTANPAKVKTFSVHGWTGTIQVLFTALGINNSKLQNRVFSGTVTSTTEFTLSDPVTNETIDGSTLGAFISGLVFRVLEIATPYVGTTWSTLRSIQADIPTLNSTTPGAVLLQSGIKPYVLQVATAPTAADNATFTFAAANFKDGPYFDPVPGGTLATPSALLGVITLTLSFNAYSATKAYSIGDYVTSAGTNYKSLIDANVGNTPALSPTAWATTSAADAIGPNGFQGTDVGRMVRLFSEPAIWDSTATYAAGAVVAYGGAGARYDGATYWKSLVGGNLNNIPGVDLTKWTLFPAGKIWTWGKITALSNIIDRALAGSANIGDMTLNGGLAAAFDGVFVQAAAACAAQTAAGGLTAAGTPRTNQTYVGKNYAAASDQAISQAVVYPSSDRGFAFGQRFDTLGNYGIIEISSLVFNLRGKASAPANSSDGTLIGTTTITADTTSPVTVVSTDTTTAWKYVWVEVISTIIPGDTIDSWSIINYCGELSFFNPSGTGTSQGVSVEIRGDNLLYTTPIRTWRLGLFSDTTTWPVCGTYHEGRLWLSGAVANRIDSSKSNDIFNFAPTNPDGSVSANNGISYIFNAPDVNPIFWMTPDQNGIVCGTQGGEWLVQATSQNLPLTPTTIQAHRYTKYNCANIEPKRTDLTLAVVQAYKRELLEYFADVYSGRFAARDLAEAAKHLVPTGMQEIAYQQETIPTLWARTGDGTLIGATYKRQSLISSQPPEFAGWHHHELGSDRTIESLCGGSNVDGTLDTIMMVTNDSTGIRHVEMLTPFFVETDDPVDGWFLDNAVRPTATLSDPTPIPNVAPYGGMYMYGLWHLNGKTVQITALGVDLGQGERGTAIADFGVDTGATFVPYADGIAAGPGGGQFTENFAVAAAEAGKIVVGLTYTSDGQIVRPNAPAESGTRNGPAFGKLRRNQQYMLLANQTTGLSIGTDFDKLDPVKFNPRLGGVAQPPGEVFSGVFRAPLRDSNTFDGMVCWRITRPLPATIVAIGAADHTQDI